MQLPPLPPFRALTVAQKDNLFGGFTHESKPRPGNPEGIRIVSRSPEYRLTKLHLPKLAHVKGFPGSCQIFVHEQMTEPLRQLVDDIEAEGLLDRILTWGGSYNPRYVRGSTTTLSSHAWGTAIDINVRWNGYGRQPAALGETGCLLEIVPIAVRLGFYWGGWFRRSDGQHLELAKPGGVTRDEYDF